MPDTTESQYGLVGWMTVLEYLPDLILAKFTADQKPCGKWWNKAKDLLNNSLFWRLYIIGFYRQWDF